MLPLSSAHTETEPRQALDAVQALTHTYEERVGTVTSYMSRAAEFMAQLREEQEAMIEQLRETLAAGQSLRRRDFSKIVGDLLTNRRERQDSLLGAIQAFRSNELALAGKLRQMLSGDAAGVASAWPQLKDRMLSLQTRERAVIRALKRVYVEQVELCEGLKSLLAKGERVRIADLKALVRRIEEISVHDLSDLAGIRRASEAAYRRFTRAWQHTGAATASG